MVSFSAYNFGCRLNQAELSSWIRDFEKRGIHYKKESESSDFIIIHSCTLTKRADSEIRRLVRQIKRNFPEKKLVVAGCMIDKQKEFFFKEGADLILDNTEKKNLVEKVIEKFKLKEGQAKTKTKYLSRGFLKIADGCNFGCTYCIIPYVRGKAVSIDEDKIKANLKELLNYGYREIIITGVNIAYYRRELGEKKAFLNLLKQLVNIKEDFYLRLTSLDPRLMDEELMDFLVREEKIAAHFHISIQNGSEKVLRRMGRWVPIKKYYDILDVLNKKRNVLLSADYIVGFSGEDEEEFKKGKEFLEKSPLNYLHIFRYSPREGTPAEKMKHPPERIAKERYEELKEFHKKRYSQFINSQLGKTLRGILIDKNRALTENYIKVVLNNQKISEKKGDLINILIEKRKNLSARGTLRYFTSTKYI